MIEFIRKNIVELFIGIVFLLIVCVGVALGIEDYSELTHYAQLGTLIDKWRENVCSTTFDGTNYYDYCTYRYTLVIDIKGRKLEEQVSNPYFEQFKIGEAINLEYDLGKLGGIHNKSLSHANRNN